MTRTGNRGYTYTVHYAVQFSPLELMHITECCCTYIILLQAVQNLYCTVHVICTVLFTIHVHVHAIGAFVHLYMFIILKTLIHCTRSP